MEIAPITAAVTAYARIDQTLATIGKILDCRPAPDELLVHVDAGRTACVAAIHQTFPDIAVIVSSESIGPGGGRNKLMAAARNDLVANFDDDSYPYDLDFFARALELFALFPKASVIGGAVISPYQSIPLDRRKIGPAPGFGGGAVIVRRKDLMEAGGYIPLPVAYAAEEEDISLRLFDKGMTILFCPWLRVFHNITLDHYDNRLINAHFIANMGTVAFLRYPKRYWLYGLGQIVNRIVWCLRVGRRPGVFHGLVLLVAQVSKYRAFRSPISQKAFYARIRSRDCVLMDF